MPVNCANWSITTTPSSASAANVRSCACLDPRCTTSPYRFGNRRCGSWPGSIVATWRIPAAAAAGWWGIWPGMGFRSAVTAYETSCAAWAYGRSTRDPAPPFQGIHPSAIPAWWISTNSLPWIRYGLLISPTSVNRHPKLRHFRHRKLSHPRPVVGLCFRSGSALAAPAVPLLAHGFRDWLRWLSSVLDAGGAVPAFFPLRPPWLASVAARRRCQLRRSRPPAGGTIRICASP